jgi:hypothetical protein
VYIKLSTCTVTIKEQSSDANTVFRMGMASEYGQ